MTTRFRINVILLYNTHTIKKKYYINVIGYITYISLISGTTDPTAPLELRNGDEKDKSVLISK